MIKIKQESVFLLFSGAEPETLRSIEEKNYTPDPEPLSLLRSSEERPRFQKRSGKVISFIFRNYLGRDISILSLALLEREDMSSSTISSLPWSDSIGKVSRKGRAERLHTPTSDHVPHRKDK